MTAPDPRRETNRALAERFRAAATLLELVDDGPFRTRAYRRVAAALEDLPEEAGALHAAGGRRALEAIEGIGKSSAAAVADLLETGRSEALESLAASVPADVAAMLELPGLGPKTVRRIWRERDIDTLDALARAVDDGSLAELRGVGARTLERIGEALAMREAAARRPSLGAAVRLAATLEGRLLGIEGVERVEVAGDARRGCETVAGLELVVERAPGADPDAILEALDRVLATENTMAVGRRAAPRERFGAALCLATGSEAHLERLRALAAERGLALEARGLVELAAGDGSGAASGVPVSAVPVAGETEASIHARLGLAWIPPELREGTDEIELARADALPTLVEIGDYRGDLHCHTRASDGTGSIDEMAEAARALGHRFLAITDHSVSQVQANGLDARRLLAHAEAVREANARIDGIELLAGTECDILADGRLDYEDAALAELDWVIASPHVSLGQSPQKATARLLRAIDNPYVNAIGHPTGRLIHRRAGLAPDLDAVFAAAAASGTALEINASHLRLDLSAAHARAAAAAGCTITLNTDAHAPEHLARLDGGLATARRAGLTRGDVLNCASAAELRRFVAAKRG